MRRRHHLQLLVTLVVSGALALAGVAMANDPPAERAPDGAAEAAEAAESVEALPDIHVVADKIDLGTIPEGTKAKASFTIENRGRAELRILRAKPS
jgi:hypothetical protein